MLCRSCAGSSDGAPLAGISLGSAGRQEIALLASVPLSNERWEPLREGEVVVLRDGRVGRRHYPGTANGT